MRHAFFESPGGNLVLTVLNCGQLRSKKQKQAGPGYFACEFLKAPAVLPI